MRWTTSGLEVVDGGCTAGEKRGRLFPGWLRKVALSLSGFAQGESVDDYRERNNQDPETSN